MRIRVFEAFAGYGSQSLALERLKNDFETFDYDIVGFSEIDKYAIQAYHAIHGEDKVNYGDISKVDWSRVPDFDLFTMSSPCQDFSICGRQAGGIEGSGTRSSLLWECRRAILEKKPKYILFENVPALVSVKFINQFKMWQNELARYGYMNYTKILNSKDYGVPQSRDRVYMISILNDNGYYEFPKQTKLTRCLHDVLEKNVDEHYLCNHKMFKYVMERSGKYTTIDNKIACAVTAKGGVNWTGNFVSTPLHTCNFSQDYKNTKSQQRSIINRIYNVRFTPTTKDIEVFYKDEDYYVLRKLTPLECLRLMDVDDIYIYILQSSGISECQLYKMAGNSIVVNVLYHIFRKLFIETGSETKQMTIFNNL